MKSWNVDSTSHSKKAQATTYYIDIVHILTEKSRNILFTHTKLVQ